MGMPNAPGDTHQPGDPSHQRVALLGRQLVEEELLHVDHDQAAVVAIEQLMRLGHDDASGTSHVTTGAAVGSIGDREGAAEGLGPDAHVVEAARSLARRRPVADAVVGDAERRGDRVDADRRRRRRTPERGGRRSTAPRAGTAAGGCAIGSSDGAVDRTMDVARRLEPERRRGVVADGEDRRRAGSVGADRRWWSSKIVERIWRIDTSSSSTARMIRSTAIGSSMICAAACSDSPVANSRWMTSSWRSRAIRSRSSSSPAVRRLLVEPGVLDRQAGGRGQPDGELLVDVGEHLAVGLVGQVQVAVDDAAQPDRHAEERRHRRVARAGTRSCRDGRAGRGAAAASGRGSADRGCRGPRVGRRCARSPPRRCPTVMNSARRDPDSSSTPSAAYLRIDEVGGRLGDAPQRIGEGLLGADRHHRVEQAQQLLRAGELEAIRHPGGYDASR